MTQEIEVKADPTKHFIPKGATGKRLMDAAGVLPFWYVEAVLTGSKTAREVYDSMTATYGFGSYEEAFRGGSVDSQGVYQSQYKEDEPMHPIVSVVGPNVVMHVYQYSMLSLVDDNETIVTRMD